MRKVTAWWARVITDRRRRRLERKWQVAVTNAEFWCARAQRLQGEHISEFGAPLVAPDHVSLAHQADAPDETLVPLKDKVHIKWKVP